MASKSSYKFEDGKYEICVAANGNMQAFRYGEPWRDLTGDKMVGAMLDRLDQADEAKNPPVVIETNPNAFRLACVVAWTELVLALRADGHDVKAESGPKTKAWIEGTVRDTFAGTPITLRDWPEDAWHENGNYECQCVGCQATFYGHKRRVVCKVCARDGFRKAVSKAREIWMEENPGEDGRDHVTPFDEFLYGGTP